MLSQKQFVAAVEAHMKATGTRPTQFGVRALGDPNFVFDLRKGRSPSLVIADRVMAFMARDRKREAA